jgi:hypothetical protein
LALFVVRHLLQVLRPRGFREVVSHRSRDRA